MYCFLPASNSLPQIVTKKALLFLPCRTYAFTMHLLVRRIAAFSILMTILVGMVTVCNAHSIISDNESTSLSASQKPDAQDVAQAHGDACPCSPSLPHTDHSHDHACQSCCHAPLVVSPILFICARSFTYLHPVEVTGFIPTVYLSLFVPPDSTTV